MSLSRVMAESPAASNYLYLSARTIKRNTVYPKMSDSGWNVHRDGTASNWSVGLVVFLVVLINTLRVSGYLSP